MSSAMAAAVTPAPLSRRILANVLLPGSFDKSNPQFKTQRGFAHILTAGCSPLPLPFVALVCGGFEAVTAAAA